jgi:predicted permease
VAVLALGVGVNLVEFQILDSLMFHRLDIRDADRLLYFTRNSRQGPKLGLPHAAIEFYQEHSRAFAWLASEDTTPEVVVEGGPSVRATLVSGNYFAGLGVAPVWGRLLDAEDARPGAPAAAVLGYDYWRAYWGADPAVVGRTVRMNGEPVRIVGVLPYTLARGLFGRRSEVWLPVSTRTVFMPGAPPVRQDFTRPSEVLFGKVKPGISQAAAEAELTTLTRELARQQPQYFGADERMESQRVQQSIPQTVRRQPAVAILLIMILLVLLSACANLGNMLLARGLSREREISIRMAIGASRSRVLRQLMTENFLLALLGAAGGVVFAAIGGKLLLRAIHSPFTLRLTFGWPIFAAGLVLTMLSTIAFGLLPALQAVGLRERKTRLRQGLIGVQVAVSCLLLIASGVLAHNGIASASVDLAFDYRNIVVVYPHLNGRSLSGAAAVEKMDALTAQLGALPGVAGITAASVAPLSGRSMVDTVPGAPPLHRNAVARSYFHVLGLPILRGRNFDAGEQGVAIVSESAARKIWRAQDALGRPLRLAGTERTVVGVVKDSGANLILDAESVEVYVPIESDAAGDSALILRARGDMGSLSRAIAPAAAALNEAVTVAPMRAMRENALEAYGRLVTLIGSIGLVASVLAATGMFALVAFTVAQRRRELGIRIAIGAGPAQLIDVLLRQNVRATMAGMAAGCLMAAMLARVVRSQVPLQSHDTVDPVGFAAGLGAFVLIALLATLSPAARALQIDPSRTLRED